MKIEINIFTDDGSLHSSPQEDLEVHEQIGLMLEYHDAAVYYFETTPIFEVVNWKHKGD